MKTTNFTSSSINYLVLILLLVSVTSCNKEFDNSRTWEGRVLEYGTELPITGARILLQDSEGEIFGPVSYITIDSTYTDSKGRFSFRTKDNIAGMRAVVSKEQYFTTFGTKSPETNFNLYLDPYAWLRVRVEKEGEVAPQDAFTMESFDCNPKSIRLDRNEFYCLCSLSGNRSHDLKYFRLPSGNQLYGRESFSLYLPGHDTTEYVIKF